jgi:hypothetical protein
LGQISDIGQRAIQVVAQLDELGQRFAQLLGGRAVSCSRFGCTRLIDGAHVVDAMHLEALARPHA